MNILASADLWEAAFRAVTPILLAALGGLLCERAGIFNLALEGLMLIGAFAAVVGSVVTGSAFGGVLVGMTASAIVAFFFAVGTVTYRADAVVLSIAFNLLAVGVTTFLLRQIYHVRGSFVDQRIQGLQTVEIPGVGGIPWIGQVVSGHTWVTYLALVLVLIVNAVLFRHRIGLRLRGVGEQPDAAASLGANVSHYKYGAILASGLLCGLAGAQLSLGSVRLFAEQMSAGRGWIAVVAVLLASARPLYVFVVCFGFGLTEAVGFQLQARGLPSQFTGVAPYVITLVVLILLGVRSQMRMRSARIPKRVRA